jgi:hypothetical protein
VLGRQIDPTTPEHSIMAENGAPEITGDAPKSASAAPEPTNGHTTEPEVAPLAAHLQEKGRKGSIFADQSRRKASVAALSQNVTGEIKNPLTGIPKAQLIQDVEQFASDNDLNDVLPILIKGALVAQSPHHVDQIRELDDEDRRVLHEEITHKWKHPRILYVLIVLNSVAAAIQGWDQTASNGANLTFAEALGISDTKAPIGQPGCHTDAICNKNSWIIGFINSCPYIAIAVL